jgi:membrane protein DedA with SNARE-associated domain
MIDFHDWPHYIFLYGYLAVFLLSILEGPLVTVFAGFLAAQGILDLFAVFATVVAGDLVGDVLTYGVGRWFAARLSWRLGERSRAFRHRIRSLRAGLRKRAGRVLLFGKLTHSLGFAVLLAAGAARIRLGVFVLYNLLGTLPKSSFFIIIGYFFGRFYKNFSEQFQALGLAALALGAVTMLYVMQRLWISQSRCEGQG